MDKQHRNHLWSSAIGKEVDTLMTLDTLEFTKTADNKKTLDNETNSNDIEFQYARILMIFDIKLDGIKNHA